MRRLFGAAALAVVATSLILISAGAAATTGTWVQYPTGATEYQAEVQQPINTANTSNWSSKSKGAIPVMFKLSSRIGPAAFESIYSDNPGNTANDFAYVSFAPNPLITFNQLLTLKTTYSFTLGNCHGGSLRWSVRIDANGNGVRDPYVPAHNNDNGTPGDPSDDFLVPASGDPALFIYYGDLPNFTDCTTNSQSDTNMIGQPDLRYDTSQFNFHVDFGSTQGTGTFYDSYADAQYLFGSKNVLGAALVIDSGWQNAPNGDQRLNVSNTYVNDNVYQFVSAAGGSFTPTCDLPPATIQVSKSDPVADGDINELPVQSSLVDTGNAFRVVDCKYQYILSIPSLQGSGTYETQIWINGIRVPTPASPFGKVKFDIK